MGNNFAVQTPLSAPPALPPAAHLSDPSQTDAGSTGDFEQKLRLEGRREASNWKLIANTEPSTILKEKWSEAADWIERAAARLDDKLSKAHPLYDEVQWIVENMRPLRAALRETRGLLKTSRTLPHIPFQEASGARNVPRAYAAARCFLQSA